MVFGFITTSLRAVRVDCPIGLPRPFCPVLVPQRHTSKIPLRNSRIICFIVVTMITRTAHTRYTEILHYQRYDNNVTNHSQPKSIDKIIRRGS